MAYWTAYWMPSLATYWTAWGVISSDLLDNRTISSWSGHPIIPIIITSLDIIGTGGSEIDDAFLAATTWRGMNLSKRGARDLKGVFLRGLDLRDCPIMLTK